VFFITMNAIVAKLRRLIGIQYEYKLEFQNFLTEAIASDLVATYSSGGNTPTARGSFVNTFIGCGPSMIFEAKRSAYGALELICEAIAADGNVAPADAAALNNLLVLTTRYVGIAEGDGEDFHFMAAAYELAREIARVVDGTEISEPTEYGSIQSLTLSFGGAGFTTDGTDDTAEGVVFKVSSVEDENPAGYADAEVVAEIIGGEIDSLTVITDGGSGFFVGQVVEINIDTTAQGQVGATQTAPATATVTAIVD
jgi:hypothetical protein